MEIGARLADNPLVTEAYAAKVERLRVELSGLSSLAVALSGGVDSSALAHAAGAALGRRSLAVTAISPSVAAEEIEAATAVAARAGIEHLRIETLEIEDPRYARNDAQRCYFCKAELFAAMERIARERGIAAIAYGAIAEDLRDFRPGARAAGEFRVLAPLVGAGLTKEEIRRYAREAGLPNADRPASACLASRIPYGTAVTAEALAKVGALERRIRALGHAVVRVRHHGGIARIEVSPERIEAAALDAASILGAARDAGYARAALDLRGYRQGAMNEVFAGGEEGVAPGLPAGARVEEAAGVALLRAPIAAFPEILARREALARAGRPFAALDLEPLEASSPA